MPPTELTAIANGSIRMVVRPANRGVPDPEVVRLLERASAKPVVRCAHCGATAARRDPVGWVVANPVVDLGLAARCGVCPDCLTAVYDFPAD